MGRQILKHQTNRTRPEFQRAAKYYGIYSRVARLVGVSPSHVRKVNLGLHVSKRVKDALRDEVKRIERGMKKAA